ncbi:MAG: Rne/Rng family ribonuclease [Planctomycetota bacterium]
MSEIEMIVNAVPGEETRIAITRDGLLEEFFQERASSASHVSNIYKAKVLNVEPAIQAAFVDFGLERNGFLHVTDLHPMYFPGEDREAFERVGKKTSRRDRPPIQKCLKRGQNILVQVLKEGLGTKGPTLTSYLSIPGRYVVMMPHMSKLGVSRKVDDDEARRETRDLLKELDPPEGFGFIIRTAGVGQSKTDLKRDMAYLQRLWKNIERKRNQFKGPGELYSESDLVIRTLRDVYTNDVARIVCDNARGARQISDFLSVVAPRSKTEVIYYNDSVPLFYRKDIERQIGLISSRESPLPSGGALVIDQTEAMVAIDVNSGKSRSARDAETNAYETNKEAADEVCRQLRLRDLGGLVVVDFIDMMAAKHRKAIEQQVRKNLKLDRSRTRIGAISQFGLMEMTRQRMRPSLRSSTETECRHCQGRGFTQSAESVLLSVMRRLAVVMHLPTARKVELTISPDVAFHLLNRKRAQLTRLEDRTGTQVLVRVGGSSLDFVDIQAFDEGGKPLAVAPSDGPAALPPLQDGALQRIEDVRRSGEFEDDQALDQLDAEAPLSEEPEDDTPEAREPGASPSYDPAQAEADEQADDGPKKKRRRRRRGGRKRRKSGDADPNDAESQDAQQETQNASHDHDRQQDAAAEGELDQAPVDETQAEDSGVVSDPATHAHDPVSNGEASIEQASEERSDAGQAQENDDHDSDGEDADTAPKKKRRRRRSRSKSKAREEIDTARPGDEDGQPRQEPADETAVHETSSGAAAESADEADSGDDATGREQDPEADPKPKKKRRRRRSRSKSAEAQADDGPADNPDAEAKTERKRSDATPDTTDAGRDDPRAAGYSNTVVDAGSPA